MRSLAAACEAFTERKGKLMAQVQSLGNVLNRLLERYGLAQRAQEITALNLWPEIVGEKIARVTEARDVREGRLFVRVENSVWRNELYYIKQNIIQELNLRLGQNVIYDIVFV